MSRSDVSARAGSSARFGYQQARASRRRRRLAQVAIAAAGASWVAGVVWLAVAPGVVWAIGGAVAALLGCGVVRPRPDPHRWLRGAAGEVATATLLERLSDRGWVVLHDRSIPGSRANLDHVVIGPTGVWVVDTKSYRAPLRAGWRSVRAGGQRIDTSTAAWEASVVADRLGVEVRAVLAVHGHGLAGRGRRVGGVRVLPAPQLVAHLRRRRGSARLRRGEVSRLAAACALGFPPARRGPAATEARGGNSRSRVRAQPSRRGW